MGRLLPALALQVALAVAGLAGGSGRAASAERVVSLNPSLTAILLALGAGDVLVGVDSFSARQQPAVAELPTVGGLYNPSLEAVVALEPDLVVFVPTAEQRSFQSQLREMGLPVVPFDPVSFDEVLATIEGLGARVGRAEAAAARVEAIRAMRRRVEARSTSGPRPRTVLVLQREPLFVIGSGSFVAQMLVSAGAQNLGAEFDEPYPRVSREWLLAARPEVILDSSHAPEGDDPMAWWRRWPSLPAVREGRVIDVPEGLVTLPGPWLDRGLAFLAEALEAPAGGAAGPPP